MGSYAHYAPISGRPESFHPPTGYRYVNAIMVICHACQRPISGHVREFRGEPVHAHFPDCLPAEASQAGGGKTEARHEADIPLP